jgi:hypothetical protein
VLITDWSDARPLPGKFLLRRNADLPQDGTGCSIAGSAPLADSRCFLDLRFAGIRTANDSPMGDSGAPAPAIQTDQPASFCNCENLIRSSSIFT